MSDYVLPSEYPKTTAPSQATPATATNPPAGTTTTPSENNVFGLRKRQRKRNSETAEEEEENIAAAAAAAVATITLSATAAPSETTTTAEENMEDESEDEYEYDYSDDDGDLFVFPQGVAGPSSEYQHWSSIIESDPLALKDAPGFIQNNWDMVMKAVQKGGLTLQFASPDQQNNKKIVMAAVQQNGTALQFAPDLQNNRDIVMAAVQQNFLAIQYAPDLQNNSEIVMAAVQKDGLALRYVTPELQHDKQVVLAAVQQNCLAIQYASPELQNDEDINAVEYLQWMSKIKITRGITRLKYKLWVRMFEKAESWLDVAEVLKDAPENIRSNENFVMAAVQKHGLARIDDKDVVMAAVKNWGFVLRYASPDLKHDKQVVMAAVNNSTEAFKYVPEDMLDDKDVALIYVKHDPDNIKHLNNKLKKDKDIKIAAGMFDEYHDDATDRQQSTNDTRKIVFSTRFSLNKSSRSQATKFTAKFKKSNFYQEGNFIVYAPNAFDKKTCDPDWTTFDWPCRGTKDTCQYNNVLTDDDGRPTDDCCWRYSYRSQLEEAKTTNGFMLQLVETGKLFGMVKDAKLGMGQTIELDMANTMGVKVFQIYRPPDRYGYRNEVRVELKEYEWEELIFLDVHIDAVTREISRWYDNQCQDMSVTIIRPVI